MLCVQEASPNEIRLMPLVIRIPELIEKEGERKKREREKEGLLEDMAQRGKSES